MSHVPGFLTKTYEIFSSPEYGDCCGWGDEGDTIVISKIEPFAKQVLPKYFKHSNYQSFVRQLNMYDFRKTFQDPNHGEFQHPQFRRDHPELLLTIKRKANSKSHPSAIADPDTDITQIGQVPAPTAATTAAAKKAQRVLAKQNKIANQQLRDLQGQQQNDLYQQQQQQSQALYQNNLFNYNNFSNNNNNQSSAQNNGNQLESDLLRFDSTDLLPIGDGNLVRFDSIGSVNSFTSYLDNLAGGYAGSHSAAALMNNTDLSIYNNSNTNNNNGGNNNSNSNVNINHVNNSGSSGNGSIVSNVGQVTDPYGNSLVRQNSFAGLDLVRVNSIGYPKEQLVSETDAVLAEMYQQRVMREQYERAIETKMSKIEHENQVLKHLFIESHNKNLMMQERMDRVMKTIYNLFVANGNSSAVAGQMQQAIANGTGRGNNMQLLLENISAAASENPAVRSSMNLIKNLDSVPAEVTNRDMHNLRKLPSIDTYNLSSAPQRGPDPFLNSVGGGNNSTSSSSAMDVADGSLGGSDWGYYNKSYTGAALCKAQRQSSFEYAASFVSAPNSTGFTYMPSFDTTFIGADNAIGSLGVSCSADATNGNSSGVVEEPISPPNANSAYPMSDRVTLLSDSHLSRESSVGSYNNPDTMESSSVKVVVPTVDVLQLSNPSASKKRKMSELSDKTTASEELEKAILTSDSDKTGSSSSSSGLSLLSVPSGDESNINNINNNNIAGSAAAVAVDTIDVNEVQEFIDMLNKNQNSTWNRLDSLESTLASILGTELGSDMPPLDVAPAQGSSRVVSPVSNAAEVGSAATATVAGDATASATTGIVDAAHGEHL